MSKWVWWWKVEEINSRKEGRRLARSGSQDLYYTVEEEKHPGQGYLSILESVTMSWFDNSGDNFLAILSIEIATNLTGSDLERRTVINYDIKKIPQQHPLSSKMWEIQPSALLQSLWGRRHTGYVMLRPRPRPRLRLLLESLSILKCIGVP